MNWANMLDWVCIIVNLLAINWNRKSGKTWDRMIRQANRHMEEAVGCKREAFNLLGVAVQANKDAARFAVALAFLFDDDAVADRTKQALVKHLADFGIDLPALAQETRNA